MKRYNKSDNMKTIIKKLALSACMLPLFYGCIEEFDPQTNYVTAEQAANAPGSFDNFVNAITNSLCGSFLYSGSDEYPFDFGYPSFFLVRDVMGQDMACEDSGSEWYSSWYNADGIGPNTARAQLPWTYYYHWINNCNTVIGMVGDQPSDDKKVGAGIAYAMRAMFYMDLARMFAPETYGSNPKAETVPFVSDKTSVADLTVNPRATNEDMFAHILEDLELAETYLDGYVRTDKFTPDVSVVYGLKARAYLTMENWAKAAEYAKKAQAGYTAMTKEQYLSQKDGFNTPNDSWIFGCTFKSDDKNILNNDADSSWGSQMIIEVSESGCGYAANYVGPKRIDAHLYSTIGESDFRRMCWVDFAIDDLETEDDMVVALSAYSDAPEGLLETGTVVSARGTVGGLPVKFRPKDGIHDNQYAAFTVAVPFMRVEEMELIEIEAVGRQDEAQGKAMLENWAKLRDPNYTYGDHSEAYYNGASGTFVNEVWWQRRVEFWGEGFATFDIKRLNKGIIRSYAGTNHPESYAWNIEKTPDWMNFCIVQTETNYNGACTNNPTPITPSGASEPYKW